MEVLSERVFLSVWDTAAKMDYEQPRFFCCFYDFTDLFFFLFFYDFTDLFFFLIFCFVFALFWSLCIFLFNSSLSYVSLSLPFPKPQLTVPKDDA